MNIYYDLPSAVQLSHDFGESPFIILYKQQPVALCLLCSYPMILGRALLSYCTSSSQLHYVCCAAIPWFWGEPFYHTVQAAASCTMSAVQLSHDFGESPFIILYKQQPVALCLLCSYPMILGRALLSYCTSSSQLHYVCCAAIPWFLGEPFYQTTSSSQLHYVCYAAILWFWGEPFYHTVQAGASCTMYSKFWPLSFFIRFRCAMTSGSQNQNCMSVAYL